jgi:uncharacterized protein (TIGR02145 family)
VAAAQATTNYDTYGVLYNWPAVMTEGICPSGWHVPSDDEWQTMEMSLGMSESEAAGFGWRGTDQGIQMKSTYGWSVNNGTNTSGLTALPGGLRDAGDFSSSEYYGGWWTASEFYLSGGSIRRVLDVSSDNVNRFDYYHGAGFSARCLQNSDIVVSYGCVDPAACNFDSSANADDGTCFVPGDVCDDGDSNTIDDEVQADCSCAGTPSTSNNCGDLVYHEGYDYATVQIGDQCWFSENCRYLPSVTANEASYTEPMYYVLNYNGTDVATAQATTHYDTYGVLYNWSAFMEPALCPSGWHVPSDMEWQTMEMALGMVDSDAADTGWRGSPVGDYLKSTSGWPDNGNGSNSSGFNVLVVTLTPVVLTPIKAQAFGGVLLL